MEEQEDKVVEALEDRMEEDLEVSGDLEDLTAKVEEVEEACRTREAGPMQQQ